MLTLTPARADAPLPSPPRPAIIARRPARQPEIVLDLSRLLSRILHPTPTGIDRVEMAYARTLMRLIPDRLAFGAVHPVAGYGRIPLAAASRFLEATQARWQSSDAGGAASDRIGALAALCALRPRGIPDIGRPRVLLQASPHHLHRPAVVAAKLMRERARLLCLVHDLIPISHPEYGRPGGAARHGRRMATLLRQTSGLLANSHATAEAMARWAGARLDDIPARVAPLGIDPALGGASGDAAPDTPYFLCLGTIEPRKNHLLLLNVWRSLVGVLGTDAPRLVLVGRRGWENENVLDMLDRCAELKGVVVELPRLADADLHPLLRGARALLMPSFAEGFGLPIGEALAAGTPVIASDLPAHRETGGAVPDYLDPLDGIGWRTAILAYAAPSNPRRAAQLRRLRGWSAGSWDDHLAIALDLAAEVAAC